MTVPDILAAAGWPHGRGRAPCPIHKGDNPQAFLYDDEGYYCFSCGAHGKAGDLARALLPPAPEIIGIEGEVPPVRPCTPPSVRMQRILDGDREWKLRWADELHREGLVGMTEAKACFPYVGIGVAGDYWAAHALVGAAHRVYRKLRAPVCCAE